MQKYPHVLIEGIVIAAHAAGDDALVHLHPRGVCAAGRHPRRRARRSARRRVRRRADPRLRHLALAGRPPRRRRLHLRRGDRPARLAGGQARQPAPEAAVPGQPGPLPGADVDQQRRDALHRADDPPHGRRRVRQARRGHVHRHEARVGLRARAAARQLRDRARRPFARDHLRPRRRAARGAQGQVLVPRRLLLPRAHRRGPRHPLRLRLDGQGRHDARLRGDHRRRRLHADPRRGAEGREVLPPRVLRQVHPLPRGHQLDGHDAGADRRRRGHADGPRDHGLRAGAHHRQLPVRARRRDGDADRLDDRQVPPRVRSAHGGRAPARPGRRCRGGRGCARRPKARWSVPGRHD